MQNRSQAELREEIRLRRKSGRPLLFIVSDEDERVEADIKAALTGVPLAETIYTYNCLGKCLDTGTNKALVNPKVSDEEWNDLPPDKKAELEGKPLSLQTVLEWFTQEAKIQKDDDGNPRPGVYEEMDPKGYDMRSNGPLPKSVLVVYDTASMFGKDATNPEITNPTLCRILKDSRPDVVWGGRMIIFVTHVSEIPRELEHHADVIEYDLPDMDLMKKLAKSLAPMRIEGAGKNIPAIDLKTPAGLEHLEEVARESLGLTMVEAEGAMAIANRTNVAAFMKATQGAEPPRQFDLGTLRRFKTQKIQSTGALELFDSPGSLAVVGGLERLKGDCRLTQSAFSLDARNDGLDPPKGILIVGPGGTGKSLIAQCLSAEWNMQAARIDIGACKEGLVGASEGNLRKALKVADTISPLIMFADEFEKMWAGAMNGANDSGVSSSMLATWLHWMQENKNLVYVVACCNDIDEIPSPVLRRFDNVYYVGLPGPVAREEILNIHFAKRGWDAEGLKIDLNSIAKVTKGFSGAELEKIVKRSIAIKGARAGFGRDKPIVHDDVLNAAGAIVPVFNTKRAEVKAIKEWAAKHGVSQASSEPEDVDYNMDAGSQAKSDDPAATPGGAAEPVVAGDDEQF